MRNILWLAALVVCFAYTSPAAAFDAAATWKTKCAICHGEKGEGKKGMGPAQKGNKFLTEGKPEDIKKTILEGRAGADKKYKEFPAPMPKSGLSDADADDMVKFLQGDLQK